MSKKKKRIRRKIKEVMKNITIRPQIHPLDLSDFGLEADQPRGRLLVEQDLSNLRTSTSFETKELYVKNVDGDSLTFDKAFPNDYSADGDRVVVISDDLIKQAIETIIELDQRVDFLQGKINGKNAPTLKRVLAAHNRKLNKFNKKRKIKRGKKK